MGAYTPHNLKFKYLKRDTHDTQLRLAEVVVGAGTQEELTGFPHLMKQNLDRCQH